MWKKEELSRKESEVSEQKIKGKRGNEGVRGGDRKTEKSEKSQKAAVEVRK